mmetsp:Transcript_120297/g.291905  ORF Transcript_120297/g.291905 Transcript_120297/m.291905 type:complete len:613 (-) Transcript_120297:159-1997(-)
MDVRLQRRALEVAGNDGEVGGSKLSGSAGQLFGLAAGNWVIEAEVPGVPGDSLEVDTMALQGRVAAAEADGSPAPFVWEAGETLERDTEDAQDFDLPCSIATVVEEAPLEHYPGYHWILSNGASVTWMRTDFEPDEVLIHGLAAGGTSDMECPAERAAASAISAMRLLCGLGEMTKSQLGEFLADKTASIVPSVSGYCRLLSGGCSASVRDFEAALRLASWHFRKPNFTGSSLAKVLEVTRQGILNREREPEHHLHRKLREFTCGDDPFFRPLSTEDVDGLEKLGLEGLQRVYGDLFTDPGAWSWVIVGAFPEDAVFRELVVRFLGLGGTEQKSNLMPKPRPPIFTPGHHVRVYNGIAESATVCACFAIQPESFARAGDRLAAQWVADVMESRLVEKLRIAAGATYSVSCSVSAGSFEVPCASRRPTSMVEFGCEPSSVESCIAALFEEVRGLVEGERPITEDELESCREKEREHLRIGERENSRWLGRLNLAVLRIRCGSADGMGPPAAEAKPAGGVPAAHVTALLSVTAQHPRRIEETCLSALQDMAPRVFPEVASVSVTLLPERLRPLHSPAHRSVPAVVPVQPMASLLPREGSRQDSEDDGAKRPRLF